MDNPSAELPPFNHLSVDPDKVQRSLASATGDHAYRKFMAAANRATKNRVFSCAREGAAFLAAVPKDRERTVDGRIFLNCVRMNLGQPLDGVPLLEHCPHCNERYAVDREGFHLLAQCIVGNQRISRHNVLVQEWLSFHRHAGYHCTTEDGAAIRRTLDQSRKKPDISVLNWQQATTLELDVVITDPRRFTTGEARPGRAAEEVEQKKNTKYKAIIEAPPYRSQFLPLAMETFGRFGEGARRHFRRLVKEIARRGGDPAETSGLANYWKQRLVIGMRRSAMEGLLDRAEGMLPTYVAPLDEVIRDCDYIRVG